MTLLRSTPIATGGLVTIAVGIVAAMIIAWLCLIAVLLVFRPEAVSLKETARLLPDVIRSVRRLASDPEVPRRARVGLWLLLGYLVLPIDLVPDFIPVIGYADDAVIVVLVLRWVIRRAGPEVVRRRWPGSEPGLEAFLRITGLPAR